MSEASAFLQIAEIRMDDPDTALRTLEETEDAWRAATVGRRTALVERLYVDRDRPGIYFAVNEFPSYDQAMENSSLPETSDLAAAAGEIVDEVVSYRNLDLVWNMRQAELDQLAEAVVRAFGSGELDPVLFSDDVTLDLNGPAGRSQAAGRTRAEQLLREDALGDEVELRSTVTESGLLIELAGRLLCDVGVERGRIRSIVAYQSARRLSSG
jgi:hypothetical protein